MAGKWAHLKGKIATITSTPEGEGADYVDKLRAKIAELRMTNPFVEDNGEPARPRTMRELAALYNAADAEKAEIKAREKAVNLDIAALGALIRKELGVSGSDIWRGEGYSFSEGVEPYASVTDRDAVREHFMPLRAALDAVHVAQTEGTIDGHAHAALTTAAAALDKAINQSGLFTIHFQTLNGMVKAAAENGELDIATVHEGTPEETTVVTSPIPGTAVYLKEKINRRKAA